MRSRHAFTIVELLVVITIIVVLLSLLTPALDMAIYQAELAVCGANLHGIASGSVVYAMDSKRAYPSRAGVQGGTAWSPAMIYNGSPAFNQWFNGLGGQVNPNVYDDRPILRTFISFKSLVDPLTGKVDFESVDADANAFSTVSLWFGFGLRGQRGMNRLGDRWTWSNPASKEDWRFDVLACDTDLYAGANVQITHPDDEGKTINKVFQNADLEGLPGFKSVWSQWMGAGGRGLADLNYAFADGSVRRYNGVAFLDSGMAHVPYYNPDLRWRATLPPQK